MVGVRSRTRTRGGGGTVRTLTHELLLELVEELECELVLGRERLLSDDSLHGRRVATNGVLGILKGCPLMSVPATHTATDPHHPAAKDAPAGSRRHRGPCGSAPRQWRSS